MKTVIRIEMLLIGLSLVLAACGPGPQQDCSQIVNGQVVLVQWCPPGNVIVGAPVVPKVATQSATATTAPTATGTPCETLNGLIQKLYEMGLVKIDRVDGQVIGQILANGRLTIPAGLAEYVQNNMDTDIQHPEGKSDYFNYPKDKCNEMPEFKLPVVPGPVGQTP